MENHTADHMKAWFKTKAERQLQAMFPNKKLRALYKRQKDEEDAAAKAKRDNPLNKPFNGE